MAFVIRNLSVLAYAQGFTLWHYRAPAESIVQVGDPEYFEEAGDMIARGDMLLASAADGGRVLFASPVRGQMRTVLLG